MSYDMPGCNRGLLENPKIEGVGRGSDVYLVTVPSPCACGEAFVAYEDHANVYTTNACGSCTRRFTDAEHAMLVAIAKLVVDSGDEVRCEDCETPLAFADLADADDADRCARCRDTRAAEGPTQADFDAMMSAPSAAEQSETSAHIQRTLK